MPGAIALDAKNQKAIREVPERCNITGGDINTINTITLILNVVQKHDSENNWGVHG